MTVGLDGVAFGLDLKSLRVMREKEEQIRKFLKLEAK